jgi:hypothetical protein
MNKSLRLTYLFFFFLLCIVRISFAQTAFMAEKDLVKKGDKLFEEEKFVEAYPIYSQLVIRAPQDAQYNYRLGVCTIYAIANKELAIPYLENAVTSPDVAKEVHYYLARAYLLSYQFEEAARHFKLYKEKADPKNVEKYKVNQQIEMCANGIKLVRNIADWIVVDKKELNKKDFFIAYDLSTIGGKLLVKPTEAKFNSSIDIKKKEDAIIFLSRDNRYIFFSSYGNDEKHGKDIYQMNKLPNGEWGQPRVLPNEINTPADEDYPFFHPNGKDLYFCSKGHNSIGGYDIFKSSYNPEKNTWSKPENIGFPINSPDDDILYATDTLEREVYFSSSRSNPPNKISVYKLNIEKKPSDWIIIKGIIKKNRAGQSMSATITVKNYLDNSRIGIFNANAATGKYFLVLPNGINCVFTVECPGFQSQSQLITVPLRFEGHAIKQELSFELNTDKLIIKTVSENFNEEEYDEIIPPVTKNRTPSAATNYKIPTETKEEGDYGSSIPVRGLNNNDIVSMAYGDAKELDEEAIELKTQADVAADLANQKNDLALQKSKEAQLQYQNAIQFTGDSEQKKVLLDSANNAIKEAEELKQEAGAAYKLSKRMESSSTVKRKEADLSLQYAQALEISAKAKNSPESMAKVTEIEKQLDDLNKNNPDTISIFNSYKIGMENKQKELDKALKNANEIKKEIADNEALIEKSQAEADKTRNKSLKEGLLNEIEGIKQDNEDRAKELKKYETKAKKLQDEYNSLVKESAMAGDVVTMAKKAEKPTAVVQNKKTPSAPVAIPVVEEFNYDQLLTEINELNAEKVDAATEVKDEIERELAKAKAYGTWYDALNTLSEEQKLNLSKEKNTQNKVQLAKLITHATQQAKEKKLLADQAAAKASRLKAAKELLAKNATAPKPLMSELFKMDFAKLLDELNARNAEKITLAEKSETEIERETEKAGAFYDWANELNKFVIDIKTKTITEADKNVNSKMGASIVKAKRMAQEKKVLGDQCAARALKLKLLAATAAAQIKTVPTLSPKPQQSVADTKIAAMKNELASAETIQDVEARERTKESIYKKIAKELDDEVAKLRIAYNKEQDQNKGILLANKIKTQESISRENKLLAKKSLAAADNYSKNKKPITPTVTVVPPKVIAAIKPPVKIEKPVAKIEVPRPAPKPVPAPVKVPAPEPPIAREIVPVNEMYNRYLQVKSEIKLAKNEKFEVKSEVVYNQDKPIPTTGVSKNGLVYTVQVGAFLNPIPQGTFGGITPITAEPTNTGYMRYFAGQFNKYKTADNVKVQIRGIGFKDAFVVAYYNGRRISLTEALRIENGGAPPSEQELAAIPITMPGMANNTNNSAATNNSQAAATNNNNTTTANKGNTAKSTNDKTSIVGGNTGNTTANGNAANAANNGQTITNETTTTTTNTADYNANNDPNNDATTNANRITDVVPGTTATTNNNTSETNNQTQGSSSSQGVTGGQQTSSTTNGNAPENISGLTGLFYTVQVGLFSQPVSTDVFYNLNPLFNEFTETGKVRYTIGIYNNIARAIEAKQVTVSSGINNSFVTAFYNSKRITLSEARQIESNGGDIFTNSPVLNILPYVGESSSIAALSPANTLPKANIASTKTVETVTTSTAVNTKQNTATVNNKGKTQPSANPVGNSAVSMEGAVFKVQIGAYREQVPADKASIFAQLNSKGFSSYVNENGLTIYTVGNFATYEETAEFKLGLAEQYGLTDVFVVAFRNGKKIPLSEVKIR